jgi:hypothetical protein
MTKVCVMGAFAIAMMSGAAFAQTMSTDTTVRSTTVSPVTGSVSSSKSQTSVDSYGNEMQKKKTVTTGVDGTTETSSSRTTSPDGTTVKSERQERTSPPVGSTSTTTSTTTIR